MRARHCRQRTARRSARASARIVTTMPGGRQGRLRTPEGRARVTARAWLELLYIDVVGLGGFRAIARTVVRTPCVAGGPLPAADTIPAVVAAVQRACSWYVRAPQCLQRSAVVVRLLRSRGVPAELVV